MAEEGFYLWKSFLVNTKVRRPLRSKFYTGRVYNTMLSGLECEVMPKGEIRHMDSLLVQWGRSIVGQENSTLHCEDARHQISQNDVRKILQVDTVASSMC